MAYVTQRLGYRALEMPILFEDRRIGQSKMTMPVKWRPPGEYGKWGCVTAA